MIKRLDFLRNKIDQIDKSLLNLLAQRLLVVTQVGELKSRYGLSIHAPDREEMMLSSRRQEAIDLGVPPDLIEDVLRRIIRESYFSENEKGFKNLCPYLRPIVIISDGSKVSKLFSRMFILSGYQVKLLEYEDWYLEEQTLRDAGVVLISVSIDLISEFIRKLPCLSDDCILVNVFSVKNISLEIMLDIHNGPVLGLQPIFNLDTKNMVKQVIIYYESRMTKRDRWFLDQIKVWGVRLYCYNSLDHDKNISLIQEFIYFIAFVFGAYLKEDDIDLKKVLSLSSSMFRLKLISMGSFFAQDPQYFINIFIHSKNCLLLIRHYHQRLVEILELLESNKKQELIDYFYQIKNWFGDYANFFYKENCILLRYIDDN